MTSRNHTCKGAPLAMVTRRYRFMASHGYSQLITLGNWSPTTSEATTTAILNSADSRREQPERETETERQREIRKKETYPMAPATNGKGSRGLRYMKQDGGRAPVCAGSGTSNKLCQTYEVSKNRNWCKRVTKEGTNYSTPTSLPPGT